MKEGPKSSNGAESLASLRAALTRERAKTRALSDIGTALGSTLDLDELLAVVVSRITEVMEADRTTVYLMENDGQSLVSRVAEGEVKAEFRLNIGEGLAGWVALQGEPLNIADAYQDLRFDAEWDRRTGYRTRSLLCVPMKNRHGRTLGVLQVLNKRDGVFTDEDASLLASLATQAAVSIENGKLFLSVINKNMELLETQEALERRVTELDLLFEIAQVSATAMALDGLLEGVVARATRALRAEAGVLLLEESGGSLTLRSAIGGDASRGHVGAPVHADSLAHWVVKHGKPQMVEALDAEDPHVRDVLEWTGIAPKSVLAVPLRGEGVRGVLALYHAVGGHERFGSEEVRTALLTANHISTAISLARAREMQGRRERLETIGQLLSSVLHDLKTPMTIVSGYVQLLVGETNPEERERFATAVQRQVELINAMTRETIAFARGDRTLWVRKVYLGRFFEDLRDQLTQELDHFAMLITIDFQDRGIAYFDEHKLQRAVHNLARNAAEASGGKGGNFLIRVDRDPNDQALLLEFVDDGPGIPEAVRNDLFDSFTTHGKAGGTGLGLAIVRKIVDDHEGTIGLRSQPGETVFEIRLPHREPDAERAPAS